MALYDPSGNKIGRNVPCSCGSGKKFKYCHGNRNGEPQPPSAPFAIPEKVERQIAEVHAQRMAVETLHGQGKPIITTNLRDHRVVAMGNEVHFSPKETTKFFPDFLKGYLGERLGAEWGKAELAKPLGERHQVLKWYDSMCRFYKLALPKHAQAAASKVLVAPTSRTSSEVGEKR
jgi:hypothetical protein